MSLTKDRQHLNSILRGCRQWSHHWRRQKRQVEAQWSTIIKSPTLIIEQPTITTRSSEIQDVDHQWVLVSTKKHHKTKNKIKKILFLKNKLYYKIRDSIEALGIRRMLLDFIYSTSMDNLINNASTLMNKMESLHLMIIVLVWIVCHLIGKMHEKRQDRKLEQHKLDLITKSNNL